MINQVRECVIHQCKQILLFYKIQKSVNSLIHTNLINLKIYKFSYLIFKMQVENRRQYQLIDLSKLCIHINKHNNFTYLLQAVFNSKQNIHEHQHQDQLQSEKKEKKQSLRTDSKQDQQKQLKQSQQQKHQLIQQSGQHEQHLVVIKIKFDLIQQQPLTTLVKQCNLFTLHCGTDLTIEANLKLSKLFDLQSINYYTQIQTAFKLEDKPSIKGYTMVNTQQKYMNGLRHKVEMYFVSQKQPIIVNDHTSITLIIANDQAKYPFSIENFIVYTQSINKNNQIMFQQSMQKPIIKNLSINNDYSYPLVDKLQLLQPQLNTIDNKLINTIDKLRQSINQIEQYQSPLLSQQQQSSRQLYICHDMKGGYLQDIYTYQPINDNNNNNKNHTNHSYRFNYLNHTQIFNYFSHYPITIPPKSWRLLCKRYNTLCLGTFIVQPNQYMMDEDDFLTEQFALKLIYIARKAKFDGYLINIEIPIKKVQLLIKWLTFLTNQINTIIPNSQIIWYDSIIIPSGQIKYQNQLNQYNLIFYQSTNGIFTNYWWNQSSLMNSLKYKKKQKPIYIGNDCWGRNTYGGGKYDIYNAINKIQSFSQNQLSIALFAPGYTYEDNAQSSLQTFTQNQLKMYHGYHVINKPITKWKITLNGGQGWKQQQQWAVTSYQLCKRQALIDIKYYKGKSQLLTVTFSCIVAGTGPNFSDHYKITLQLYDYKNNQVYYEVTHPNLIATQKQQRVQIKMEIDCEIISDGICLRLLEEGKDAQFWAGHFGTRFKGQTISFSTQNKIKNWINTIPLQPANLNRPYITFFNKGQGSSFYYLGKQNKQNYDSLCDYDFPPVYSLNNPSDLQVQYKDGYVGGSCLRFRGTNKIFVNKFKVEFNNGEKQKRFKSVLIVKETQVVSIVNGKDKIQIKPNELINSVVNNNGWKSYSFQMVIQEKNHQFKIQCKFNTNCGLIGYLGIFQTNKLIKKDQLPLRLSIKSSNKPKYIFPYCVDIELTSHQFKHKTYNIPQRLLLKMGQFSGFVNIDKNKQNNSLEQIYQLKGYLKNIPILNNKYKQYKIKLINTNQQGFNVVLQQTIGLEQLKKLTENKCLHYQFKL